MSEQKVFAIFMHLVAYCGESVAISMFDEYEAWKKVNEDRRTVFCWYVRDFYPDEYLRVTTLARLHGDII